MAVMTRAKIRLHMLRMSFQGFSSVVGQVFRKLNELVTRANGYMKLFLSS